MQAAEKEKDGSSLRQQQQQQQSKLQLESSVVPVVEEQEQDQEAGDSSNRRGAQSPDWEMAGLGEGGIFRKAGEYGITDGGTGVRFRGTSFRGDNAGSAGESEGHC